MDEQEEIKKKNLVWLVLTIIRHDIVQEENENMDLQLYFIETFN